MAALVTGGGSGIGFAICRSLTSAGFRVGVLDLDVTAATRVADSLEGAVPLVADVSDRRDVEAAFGVAADLIGPIDVLVNCAGYVRDASLERRLRALDAAESAPAPAGSTTLDVTVNVTDEEWRRMLAVHLDGTFFCTRAALEVMVPRGRGAIVNVASIAGIEGSTGSPHYSAAKGGVLAFTRAVAKEVIAQGIRVNAVAPGYVDTPMASDMSDGMRRRVLDRMPIGRLGTADEVAAAVHFLASDSASFFVGETLSPNGGAVTV